MDGKDKDFLDGLTEDRQEVDAVEAPEPPEVEKVETETPDKPAKTEAPTATDPPKDDRVPLASLKAEREKRQERDRKLEIVERELAELRQKAQQQPEVGFFEAPEQYLQQHVQAVERQATERLYAALEAQARETYPDYDEVFAELKEQAQENPVLVQRVLSSPNPALAAYKLGKQLREHKLMQDPEAYRAKIEAEIRASLEKEFEAKRAEKFRTADALPPDLAANRSADGQFAPAPDVFGDIFKPS